MRATEPQPVKFFASVITSDSGLMQKTRLKLESEFGGIDFETPELEFENTDYYAKELGPGLKRKIFSFMPVRRAVELPGIKLMTNAMEGESSVQAPGCDKSDESKRRVNIDPGYLTLHNVVLATCKNFSHRVYLERGVYAELTYMFNARKQGYDLLDWTYPDYRTDEIRAFFKKVRGMYQGNLESIRLE